MQFNQLVLKANTQSNKSVNIISMQFNQLVLKVRCGILALAQETLMQFNQLVLKVELQSRSLISLLQCSLTS